MKILSVRLDDAEAAALRELCAQQGLTRTQAVKRWLACLQREAPRSTPGELARKLGLYGCDPGTARDLSERASQPGALRRVLRAKAAR
jgi:hypothetical protein